MSDAQKKLEDQLKESGYSIMFYETDGIDPVAMEKASEFTVVRFEPYYNMFRGKMLKRKTFDLDYVLEFVAKKESIQYINYRPLFEKIGLNNVGFYNTSYGIGVEVLFGSREETIQKITNYLNENGIAYTNEFSEARWVYRFKFSKSAENIDRIKSLVKN